MMMTLEWGCPTSCPLSLSMIQLLFWMTMILLDRPLSIRPPASRHLLRTTLSIFLSCVGIPNPSNFKDLISWSMNPVSREDSSLHLLWMTRTSFLSKPHQCNCSRNPVDEQYVILADVKHSSSSSCPTLRRLAGLARSRMPDDILRISRGTLEMETHLRPSANPSTSPVRTCGWSIISLMQAVGFCIAARSSGRSFTWALIGSAGCVSTSRQTALQRHVHQKNYRQAVISHPLLSV